MSVSDADIAFAQDLFSELGQVTGRKMFGGYSLYLDGTIFALVSAAGTIYLKASGSLADELIDDGAEQFHSMPYWSLPDTALEDPEVALDLAKRTLRDLIAP